MTSRKNKINWHELSEIFELTTESLVNKKKKKAYPFIFKDNKRRTLNFNGVTHPISYLICLLAFGQNEPEDVVVDHINGIPHDDRPENLRFVNMRENALNNKKLRTTKIPSNVALDKSRNGYIVSFQEFFIMRTKNLEVAEKAGGVINKHYDELLLVEDKKAFVLEKLNMRSYKAKNVSPLVGATTVRFEKYYNGKRIRISINPEDVDRVVNFFDNNKERIQSEMDNSTDMHAYGCHFKQQALER